MTTILPTKTFCIINSDLRDNFIFNRHADSAIFNPDSWSLFERPLGNVSDVKSSRLLFDPQATINLGH
jgi:hypothetical protein